MMLIGLDLRELFQSSRVSTAFKFRFQPCCHNSIQSLIADQVSREAKYVEIVVLSTESSGNVVMDRRGADG